MPHAGCCRGRRGDGFETSIESSSASDGDFFIGDAPLNYSPSQQLEIVHTDINVDLKDMKQKLARFVVVHTVACNHLKFKSLSLNGIGMSHWHVSSTPPKFTKSFLRFFGRCRIGSYWRCH
jgi:hypothetical protein